MTSFNNMIKVALTNFALSEGNSFKPTTTIKMRISFKLLEEYIQNDDLELTNTNHTTNILSKGGDNFFMAHIEDRVRY